MYNITKIAHKITGVLLLLLLNNNTAAENQKKSLRDFRYNKYSQFGEDGIIEKIFDIIGTTSKLCVEFGAWDGVLLANTALLYRHKGWKAILIEADKAKYNALVKNTVGYNCIPVCKYVGIESHNSIDAILQSLNINEPIDLMSIDIDGDDYYIFDSLKLYKPRLIICERNATLPAHLDIYQNYGDHFGCSVGALVRLGKQKGYTLLTITDANTFFIDNDYLHYFDEFEPVNIRDIDSLVNYLAYNYAGQPIILSTSPSGLFTYGINNGFKSDFNHNHGVQRVKSLIKAKR